MDILVVLVHSPLVGSFTWSLTAAQLHMAGIETLVPVLTDGEAIALPYWRQHAESVRQALEAIPAARPLILVAHSGAGPLLPAIYQAIRQPVSACIFVDAGLPHAGKSRLDEMEETVPTLAEQFRPYLVAGGSYPEWKDEDLREDLPDEQIRQSLLAELHPRPLAFFTESMPVVEGWSTVPGAYLQLSQAYTPQAKLAEQAGWPCCRFDAGHFHM